MEPEDFVSVRAPGWGAEALFVQGEPFTLNDALGQTLVLDFFTPGCVNCVHLVPELAAAAATFSGQALRFLGILTPKFDHEGDPDAARAAVVRARIHHPVLIDVSRRLWQEYAIRAWPTVVIIDKRGRIAWQRSGEVGRRELVRALQAVDPSLESRAILDAHRAPTPGLLAPTGLRRAGQRLILADTGNDRIVTADLTEEDGWPHLRIRQVLAGFNAPRSAVRVGEALWVADTGNHRIVQVVNAQGLSSGVGSRTVVAGTGGLGDGAAIRMVDPHNPTATPLRSPWAVDGRDGMAFVAMAGAHQIWIFHGERGTFQPFLGSSAEGLYDGPPREAALAQPSDLRVTDQALYWVDAESSSVRQFKLADGRVETLVGAGLFAWGDRDGPLHEARLQHPEGLVDDGSTLYIADTYNGSIRAVDLQTRQVSTVARGLAHPTGIEVVGRTLIVAETGAHRLVAIRLEGGERAPVPVEFLPSGTLGP